MAKKTAEEKLAECDPLPNPGDFYNEAKRRFNWAGYRQALRDWIDAQYEAGRMSPAEAAMAEAWWVEETIQATKKEYYKIRRQALAEARRQILEERGLL